MTLRRRAPVAALLLLALSSASHALSDHLVLSEIVVDVSGAESAGEFVEIYNPTGETVSIGGWDLAYKSAAGASFGAVATIPSGREIGPYGFFLVGGDAVTPTPDHVDTSLGFAATAGHVALRNSSNVIIDKVGYGATADSAEGSPAPVPGQDQSIERRPGASASTKGNGQDGDTNSGDFDTRATAQPQNAASGQEIPDSVVGTVAATSPLKFTTATTNVTVTDADRNNKAAVAEEVSIQVTSLADPAGITLAARETADSASTFDLVTAGDPLGLTLGASSAAARLIKVRASGDTITIAYRDPAPAETVTATVVFQGVGRVVVNEFVFNPTGTDQGNEWVELFNADDTSVDVGGWTLTNEDAGTVMEMPSGVVLPSGAFLQWWVDAAGTNDTDFSDLCGTVYSGTATTVSLTNTNDQVSLYASTTRDKNTIVDFVQYSTTGSISEPGDAQNAVDVGLWPTTDTFANVAAAPEGAGIRLLPDGNDQNRPGDWSIDSSPTPCTTNAFVGPPSVPQNLDAIAGVEQTMVVWDASTPGSDPLAGYRVYRSTDPATLAEIAFVATTSYTDTNVAVGTAYHYAARAEDVGGVKSDTSNTDSATPQAFIPPGPPQNLVGAGNPFVNDLTWDTATKGSWGLSQYRIHRSTTAGAYGDSIAEVSATKTKYSDSNVDVGTQYFYVVLTIDTSGAESDSSNEVTVVAQGYADPPPPGSNVQWNEIMYDPAGSEPANEWVELFNPTDTPIALDGLILEDNAASFTIPAGNTIAAQGFFVLGYSATAAGGNVDLVYGSASPNIQLANTGDTVTLRTDTAIIDRLAFTSAWGGAEPTSLGRKFSGGTTQDVENWGHSKADSGTPRAVNDVDTLPPLITHTPPARAAAGRDLGVHATVTDNEDKDLLPGTVSVLYRTQGETAYQSVTMSRVSGDMWDGVVPGTEVETPAFEYLIRAIDSSNNTGTFATFDTPQVVAVVVIDTKIVVNEFMYDPAESEPDNEWVEIYNYGDTVVDVSGWKLTDAEGLFTIPQGTTINAGGYLVLERSETATPVSGVVYGNSAPSIQFQNILAVITDQVIIQDAGGLVVDEVNYAAAWGGNNITGPNRLTLERVRPTYPSNESATWIYSYVQGGTPGETNSSKIVRDVTVGPSFINPYLNETAAISFKVVVDSEAAGNTASVTLRIRDGDGAAVRTIRFADVPAPGTYAYDTFWAGENDAGETVLDVFGVEVEAIDRKGEVSTHNVDDRTPLGFNDRYSTYEMYTGQHETVRIDYFTAKPLRMTILIQEGDSGPTVRTLLDRQAVGAGNQTIFWEGRRDDGAFHFDSTSWPITGEQFLVNALVCLPRFEVVGETVTPERSFRPAGGETLAVHFHVGDSSTVTAVVRTENGDLVRTLLSNVPKDFGTHAIEWDGKDGLGATVAAGTYLVIVDGTSIDGYQKGRFLQQIGVRP